MPTGDSPTKPKISGHAVAALCFGIAAMTLPAVVVYFVRMNRAIGSYLYKLSDGYAILIALMSFISVVLGVVGIVAGWKARKQIKNSEGIMKGKGCAWAGLTLNSVAFFVYLLLFLTSAPFSPLSKIDERNPINANQALAVRGLQMIHISAESYRTTYHRGYPLDLSSLGPPQAGSLQNAQGAGLIDETLASGAKSGYVFIYQVTSEDEKHRPSAYTVTASRLPGVARAATVTSRTKPESSG